MVLNELKNLKYYSQFSLKDVEDRILLTAEFPKEFLTKYQMREPFLYVTLYVRGGARIKIIDEDTAEMHIPTLKEFDQATYQKIIQFAMQHSTQFKKYANRL